MSIPASQVTEGVLTGVIAWHILLVAIAVATALLTIYHDEVVEVCRLQLVHGTKLIALLIGTAPVL
jgi:hypothetical protein